MGPFISLIFSLLISPSEHAASVAPGSEGRGVAEDPAGKEGEGLRALSLSGNSAAIAMELSKVFDLVPLKSVCSVSRVEGAFWFLQPGPHAPHMGRVGRRPD